jgi:hypothetical protein
MRAHRAYDTWGWLSGSHHCLPIPWPLSCPDESVEVAKRLVEASTKAVPLTDGVTTNVWAVSTSDGALHPLTDFGERATFIARRVCWSRDGRFVFAAVGEGDADVVVFRGLKP